jgi:hypothetical protein
MGDQRVDIPNVAEIKGYVYDIRIYIYTHILVYLGHKTHTYIFIYICMYEYVEYP